MFFYTYKYFSFKDIYVYKYIWIKYICVSVAYLSIHEYPLVKLTGVPAQRCHLVWHPCKLQALCSLWLSLARWTSISAGVPDQNCLLLQHPCWVQAARNVVVLLWSCDDILSPASSSCLWFSTVLYYTPFLSYEMQRTFEAIWRAPAWYTVTHDGQSGWACGMYGCWEVCLQLDGHVDKTCPKLAGRCIPSMLLWVSRRCVLTSPTKCWPSVWGWCSVVPDHHRVSIVSGGYLVYAYRVTCRTINVKVEMILVTSCNLVSTWM